MEIPVIKQVVSLFIVTLLGVLSITFNAERSQMFLSSLLSVSVHPWVLFHCTGGRWNFICCGNYEPTLPRGAAQEGSVLCRFGFTPVLGFAVAFPGPFSPQALDEAEAELLMHSWSSPAVGLLLVLLQCCWVLQGCCLLCCSAGESLWPEWDPHGPVLQDVRPCHSEADGGVAVLLPHGAEEKGRNERGGRAGVWQRFPCGCWSHCW